MANAIWLSGALPIWFFWAILTPFWMSPLTAIPATGAVALLGGAILAWRARERGALWTLVPLGMSHLWVAIAGFFRGAVSQPELPLIAFLVLELLACGWVAWSCARSRLAGLLLGWFCMSYALMAALIGAMSLPDVWL